MDVLKSFFEGLNRLHTEQQQLAAIWLEKPLVTGEGKTCRIAPDATICIIDGKLMDCNLENKPTHKVIGCIGTMYNQFEFTLLDLTNNQPSQFKI